MKISFCRALLTAVILACVISSAFMSAGCSGGAVADPFRDFSGDISAQCSANVQGAISKIVFSRVKGEIKAEFFQPKTLEGVSLCKKEGGYSIGYGGFYVDIGESAALMLNLCEEVFAPHYSEMTVIRSEERDGEKLTVIESGGFIYHFSKDGSPLSISGVFDGRQFEITLDSIAPAVAENGENER